MKQLATQMKFAVAAVAAAGTLSLGGCAGMGGSPVMAGYPDVVPDREGMNYTCQSDAAKPRDYTNQWGEKYRDLGVVVSEPTLEESQQRLAQEMSRRFPGIAYKETCESVFLTRSGSSLEGTVYPVSIRKIQPQVLQR